MCVYICVKTEKKRDREQWGEAAKVGLTLRHPPPRERERRETDRRDKENESKRKQEKERQ